MRPTILTACALAAVAMLVTPIFAQSGSRNAVPSIAPTPMPPTNVPTFGGPIAGSPGFNGQIGSQVFGNAPTTFSGNPTFSSPMAFSGPVGYGNAFRSSQSAAYGPSRIGAYPQGPACCNLAPTQPGYCLQPVSSCCGNLGRHGIPPLTTPLRWDTPPIGASVGRPLFGRWNGF